MSADPQTWPSPEAQAIHRQILRQDPVGHWSRNLISAARDLGPVPRYGSTEWIDLPVNDPRRLAAVVIAAECWRLDEPTGAWAQALRQAEQDGVHQAAVDEFEDMWRRTLAHINRVDRARAAGSDIGLPLAERIELARRPQPTDRERPAGIRAKGAA
ncbi:hypothetical protein [Candidatus Frankia nodulisporulans]|uniref:hypothetical protein n=1 Tax=Candidatus Frankia nodulisporulans TaxID=2060052 RepID=UPI0013D3ECDC|nr:hypothetical protein [Candidatus Frankia nodulisporulans]